MDKFDRIYELHKLFSGRRTPLSMSDIMARMECSKATAKRGIETLRDQLNAPLVYDRDQGGYLYADGQGAWELPGLWLTSRELVAMLAAIKFLNESGQGVVSEMLRPFRQRLEKILAGKYTGAGELIKRVKILSMNARPQGDWFHVVAEAVARRRQLDMRYHDRAKDSLSERTVSPQRLVHYRDVWYLDAWCHAREGLRTFSLDRISHAHVRDDKARDIGETQLDAELAASYGIFSGAPVGVAVLDFTPTAARWVRSETWHRDQKGEELAGGGYRLHVPYSQAIELVRDILRFGAEVKVQQPDSLVSVVASELARAAAHYEK